VRNLISFVFGKKEQKDKADCVIVAQVPPEMLASFEQNFESLRLTEFLHPDCVQNIRQHMIGVASVAYLFGLRDGEAKK